MMARGDIYEREYEGLYCVGCEEFKTEDEVVVENGEKVCPIHRKPVERGEGEELLLPPAIRYEADLLEAVRAARVHSTRVAPQRGRVVRARRSQADLGLAHEGGQLGHPGARRSRARGLRLDRRAHELPHRAGRSRRRRARPGQGRRSGPTSHHIIAKDILRFHAVYWPAMLVSAGLPPPKGVFCHGYLTVKGQKISKSIPATRVDPNAIVAELGDGFVDPLRYFVLREYTLRRRRRLHLRGAVPALRIGSRQRPRESAEPDGVDGPQVRCRDARRQREPAPTPTRTWPAGPARRRCASGTSFQPSRALEAIWSLIRELQPGIELRKPWALAKDPAKRGGPAARAPPVHARRCAGRR